MTEIQISKNNIDILFDAVNEALAKEPLVLVTINSLNTGDWGMAKLWRKWMSLTAKYMAANGVTMPLMIASDGTPYGTREFNINDAHDLFTIKWLRVDGEGIRLSWSKKGHDGMRPATKWERFHALRQHENWCIEKGLKLFIPRDSEYAELTNEQDGS